MGYSFVNNVPLLRVMPGSTYRRVEVYEDGARNIFAATSFGEEGLERAALDLIL